jgi:hypothetical protein
VTDFFRELPFDPDDDDSHVEAAAVIIEAMGMDLDSADLVALLRLTRHAHRMALSDFKRRNDPAWRVPRARPRGRRLYDYGKDTGAGLEDWPAWWASIWARPRANPGRFRGTRIAKQPLVAVYHLCNRWWRRTTGEAFWPDFKHQISYRTDSERMPHLNDAARLFLLVAQDCDRKYNCDLCSRVHDVTYRALDRRIP